MLPGELRNEREVRVSDLSYDESKRLNTEALRGDWRQDTPVWNWRLIVAIGLNFVLWAGILKVVSIVLSWR